MFKFISGLLLIVTPVVIMGQPSEECGFELDLFASKAADMAFESFHKNKPLLSDLKSIDTLQLPLRFTVFRLDDGTMPYFNGRKTGRVAEQEITRALANLNNVYSTLRVKFVLAGPINYVDNSKAQKGDVPAHYFSFTSSNANGIINQGLPSGVAGRGNRLFIPPPAYNKYGPTGNGMFALRDSVYLLRPTLVHEIGHVFGLLHTFHGGDKLYDNPADPIENSPLLFADRDTRELVIREEVSADSVPFPTPNYRTAGDRLKDTPAWGRMNTHWPNPTDEDCSIYKDQTRNVASCSFGFLQYDCIYRGNYVDYNGHELENTDVSISNFMSYSDSSPSICRTSFTNDQYLLQNTTIRNAAVELWNNSDGIRFTDSVFYWNSSIPVKDANINFKHPESGPAQGRYARVTSSSDGSFSATLFDSLVRTKASVLGSGEVNRDYRQSADTSYNIYQYTDSDWLTGVSTADLLLLVKYILGLTELNAFQQLSADVNRDGKITIQDAIEIKRQILGQVDGFSKYPSGPWQFVPEVIATSSGFAADPFNMVINGTAYQGNAPYLSSTFSYSPVPGSKAGFSAYKLGDITGDALTSPVTHKNPLASNCPGSKKSTTLHNFSSGNYVEPNAVFQYRISPTSSGLPSGIQGELVFDNSKMRLIEASITDNNRGFDTDAYSITSKGPETTIRFSCIYYKKELTKTDQTGQNEGILSIDFEALVEGIDPSEEIVSGPGLPLEVYQENGCLLAGDLLAEIYVNAPDTPAVNDRTNFSPDDFTLAISPNPANDEASIIIKSSGSERYHVTVFSITTGRQVKQWQAQAQGGYYRRNVDVSGLPTDVYLIKVTDSRSSQSLKLVKI